MEKTELQVEYERLEQKLEEAVEAVLKLERLIVHIDSRLRYLKRLLPPF